jgi:hypothetical protein
LRGLQILQAGFGRSNPARVEARLNWDNDFSYAARHCLSLQFGPYCIQLRCNLVRFRFRLWWLRVVFPAVKIRRLPLEATGQLMGRMVDSVD